MNPPYLESFESTSKRKRIYKLYTDETFVIGRDIDSDIVITETEFSGTHAKIDYCLESRKWYFTMKGRREFMVNDMIHKSMEPLQLKEGMKITLDTSGRYSYVVRLKSSPRKKEMSRHDRRTESTQPSYAHRFVYRTSSSEDEDIAEKIPRKRKRSADSPRRAKCCCNSSEMRRNINRKAEENQRLRSEIKELQKMKPIRHEKLVISKHRKQLKDKEERLKIEKTQLNELKEETMNKIKEMEDKKSAVRKEIREEVQAVQSVEQHERQKEMYQSLKEQVMLQFTDIMENELQCSVCTDFFINPVLLQCLHTFCGHCIRHWKKTNNMCPVCRSEIKTVSDNVALMNLVEQSLLLFPEEVKQKRIETKAKIAAEVAREGEPSTSPSSNCSNTLINIIFDNSSDTSSQVDDDDNRSSSSSTTIESYMTTMSTMDRPLDTSSPEYPSETEDNSTSEDSDDDVDSSEEDDD